VEFRFYQFRGHLQKKSGTNISTRIFQNPAYSFISGILYSKVDLWNKPTSLGDDFIFLHNPLASQKLDIGWLNKGRYIWLEDNQIKSKNFG